MFYKVLSRLVEGAVILGATIIVSTVTVEVILRYIFGRSLIFTDELARYLMVWIVFLGSALALRDNTHIGITVLVDSLGPRGGRAARLIALAFNLVLLVIVLVEGIKILPRQLEQMCITLPASLFPFYLAIPVGCLLMILFLLPKIRSVLAGEFKPSGPNVDVGA